MGVGAEEVGERREDEEGYEESGADFLSEEEPFGDGGV